MNVFIESSLQVCVSLSMTKLKGVLKAQICSVTQTFQQPWNDVYNVFAKPFSREKPETSLELTPSKKRTELIPTSNSEIESTQKNQAVEVRIPGIHRMSVLVSWSLLTASCFTLRLINICTDMRDWLCVF